MKILICSLTYPLRNGVSNSINATADGFLAAGHQVMIVAPDYEIGRFRPEHRPIPSSLIGRLFLKIFGKEERMFSIDAKGRIEKLATDFQPDVMWLHTTSWLPNAFERAMIGQTKAKKLLTYHTRVEEYGRAYAGSIGASHMRNRSRDLCNQMDHIITPSLAIKQLLLRYEVTKPVTVIPTGIPEPKNPISREDLRERFNLPSDRPVLLFVGRIAKEKNIGALIDLAKNLKKNKVLATLLLIGPGDLDFVTKQAEQAGLSQEVRLAGSLPADETRRIYGAADLFVFASTTETQALAINEAMIADLPIVAVDSQISKEVYPDDCAIVVAKPSELFQGVIKALEHPKETRAMAKRAKKFVLSNFSLEIMIKRQLALLSELIEGK